MKPKEEIIIDAQGSVVGRMATFIAKKLLQGHKVVVLNSEKAILIGNKVQILERHLEKRRLGKGVQKGPHYPYKPDMMLRRSIRGMLPWKRTRGRQAYKNLICLQSIPEEYHNKKAISLAVKKPLNFISLGELSKAIRPEQRV